jgi:polyisoprenoid-binding protein YceI
MGSCGDTPSAESDTTTETNISGIYTVDVANTVVQWKGTMLGIKYHEGNLNLLNGSLNVEDGKVVGGNFTVDMSSMMATDSNFQPEEGSTREKLLGHLASPDFFDVANNPTATFVIKSGDGPTATGDLTIRGINHSESVKNISLTEENGVLKANGNLTFNRKDYNVSWDSPMKDVVLSNDVELSISLAASK